VVHVSHDIEAIARLVSPGAALAAVAERRGRTYDPALADLFAVHGAGWLERLAKLDPWDAVLDLEPAPGRLLSGEALDEALIVVATSWTSSRPTWPGSADGARTWSTAPPASSAHHAQRSPRRDAVAAIVTANRARATMYMPHMRKSNVMSPTVWGDVSSRVLPIPGSPAASTAPGRPRSSSSRICSSEASSSAIPIKCPVSSLTPPCSALR
jgi:hypothetical protein